MPSVVQVLGQTACKQAFGTQCHGHFMQTRWTRFTGQIVNGTDHFNRVTRTRRQGLVHVGQQRTHVKASPRSDGHNRFGQRHRQFRRWHKSAGTDLDVHHQRIKPARQLLRQNRRGDQRDRFNGSGHITCCVDALVGRRQIVGLANNGCPRLAHRCTEQLQAGERVITGNRTQFVQRTAGMTKSAPGNHRVEPPAGGEHRAKHQGNHIANTTRGMFIDDRTAQIKRLPLHDPPRIAHGQGQIDTFITAHAIQKDGHGEGGDLRLAHAVISNAANEGLYFFSRQYLFIPLVADDFLRQ